MGYLIFIDTNIFLDFYRVVGREGDLSILTHLDDHRDRIITTYQVEMEFKKNRQRVILDAYRQIKRPDTSGMKLPAFFSASKEWKTVDRVQKSSGSFHNRITARIERILGSPARYDAVYKTAQRLFREDSDLNLTRSKTDRFRIRRLAWKRFILGYPPRKSGDTQTGDAINWEWLVQCAVRTGDHVIIVSRDSDYGLTFEKSLYINEWLQQEFRERVSAKRKLVLTDRLSAAFKLAKVPVTEKEQKAEDELIRAREDSHPTNPAIARLAFANVSPNMTPVRLPDDWQGWYDEMMARLTALSKVNLDREGETK